MNDKRENSTQMSADAAALRKLAEKQVRTMDLTSHPARTPEEIQRVLHELRVHEIELEMQNEELRRAQAELDAARAWYFDLYDLAPVGYCTVSEPGLILEANLTVAGLLSVARGEMLKQPFTRFIVREDQDIYYRHRKQLFETGEPQACEIRMLCQDAAPFWAHLEATAAQDADGTPVCRVVLSNITERKEVEDVIERSRDELESRVQERTAELARTNDQLRILASELTLAEEHERRRLAVELHDGLDQNLSLAEMKLGELLKSPQATGLNRPLREIKQLIVQANRQARSLTFQLSPAVLYDIGLAAALEWLAEQMQLRHGIKITLEDDEQVRSIQIEPRILLFRALRELVINVVKHARASRAQVSIRLVDEDLRISIEDDGAGFDPATVGSEGSWLGLFGIRERLSPLGGRMEIDSARGRGTRVTLIVPAQRVIAEAP